MNDDQVSEQLKRIQTYFEKDYNLTQLNELKKTLIGITFELFEKTCSHLISNFHSSNYKPLPLIPDFMAAKAIVYDENKKVNVWQPKEPITKTNEINAYSKLLEEINAWYHHKIPIDIDGTLHKLEPRQPMPGFDFDVWINQGCQEKLNCPILDYVLRNSVKFYKKSISENNNELANYYFKMTEIIMQKRKKKMVELRILENKQENKCLESI